MAEPRDSNTSSLWLEEYFSTGDDRFLDALYEFHSPKALARIADRWKNDPRPWARRQVLRYLERPLDCAGHEPIVKRLFKHFETQADDEIMAAFMVAFDRLVRRRRKTRTHYDWRTRTIWQEESLVSPRDRVHSGDEAPRIAQNPKTLESIVVPPRPSAHVRRYGGHLFSYRTRYYLRRRVWRYFRRMGFQRPDDHVPAVAEGLRRYRDEDLAAGENILDCWSLLQACFRYHPALEFDTSIVKLREGHTLGELAPAPKFPKLWKDAKASVTLIDLVAKAQSRLVRVWAIQLLKAEHEAALRAIDPHQLIKLLDHDGEEVQQFAAEVFGTFADLSKLDLDTWLTLLETKNPQALAIICDAMARHVAPERLDLARCVDLACAAPTPVARTGFALLQKRDIPDDAAFAELPRLADMECAAVGEEVTRWALERLGAPGLYNREAVIGFFDALLPTVRRAALEWLRQGSTGYGDPVLWARLIETPFDDVRFHMVSTLERRAAVPGAGADTLAPIWCAVVLGVHRGGRQKPKAVQQLAAAIASEPDRFEKFGPLLAIAVQSIRGPERRAGLAAVAALAMRRPELAGGLEGLMPGLRLAAEGAAS